MRKGVALSYPSLSIKNAEYHQKNFSDPLMILRMKVVTYFDTKCTPLILFVKRCTFRQKV